MNTNNKTAIMQPYFLPYIGYFQLICAADTFVVLDDVNFIMKGWINRNTILLNGNKHLFTIPLSKPSQNKLIQDTKLNFSSRNKNSFLKTIQLAYKKAPFFSGAYSLLENIILYEETDLTTFILHSLKTVLAYLSIEKKICKSSEIEKDTSLKGQDKIIELCKKFNTETYINPIGGMTLYQQEKFDSAGINLRFIQTDFDNIRYKQFKNEFINGLSFIDILMFNSVPDIQYFLQQYRLITAKIYN